MATESFPEEDENGTPQKKTGAPHIQRIVSTSLNYYDDPGDASPPAPVVVGGTTVTNERTTTPMELVRYETKTGCTEDGYRDVKKIKLEYCPECEQLLKNITGADRAFIFDHKVRRGPSNWHKLGSNNSSKRGPLHRVHVDQSYHGAEYLVGWYLPVEADTLLKKRWQIINVWRPIRTIYRNLLAVADARSISESDLVAAKVIYPDHQRETWTVKPNPTHKWYFKNEQKPNEVMFIKYFDTAETGARRVPHSAFHDSEHEDKGSREY